MKKTALKTFCELFYASHYIPIAIFDDKGKEISVLTSQTNIQDLYCNMYAHIKKPTNPVLHTTGFGRYGVIDVNNGAYSVIIGPVFNCIISKEIVDGFMHEHGIPFAYQQEAFDFINALPQMSYNQFVNLIIFVHYQLNGENIDFVNHFKFNDKTAVQSIARNQAETLYIAKEEQTVHGTYYFEQQLMALVKSGNVARLQSFLLQTIKTQKLNEGKLADTPLRQAKNLLIGLATIVGKTALIEGGIDIEQAYQMIDVYIQECEKCNNLETVKILQYNMLMDFTERVSEEQTPEQICSDVNKAIQFIKSHTNSTIGVSEVVEATGRSKSWLCDKFREELNTSIAAYITFCKLEESKMLLRHTDKPISEISNYFYFSSQSYFQNLFKKQYGITPDKYRKKHAKHI